MTKEDFFRRVILGGITEGQIRDEMNQFGNWEYKGQKPSVGSSYLVFQNEAKGAEVYIQADSKSSFIFGSKNVLPIDGSNLNSSKYEEGYDSSEEQATSLVSDVLYDFCIHFNKKAKEVNENTNNWYWCAIVPSDYDISVFDDGNC